MHRFFTSISEGELIRRPDNIDKLADMGKKVAEILPNISVSTATLGLPIPIYIDFPSSVAVAAVIDLCLYIREESQQSKADRIKHFFDAMTFRDRTNAIYYCSELVARQFKQQIEVLDNQYEGIPYFAEMMVVRVFEYMVKRDSNLISSESWFTGTLFRKAMSFVFDVGPEPETIHKSLNTITADALSNRQYLLFKNKAEERRLMLSSQYRDPTGSDPNRQWTVKGILENTGIRTENGNTYAGTGQDVAKYGYTLGTEEEALTKRMKPSREEVLWFVNEPEIFPRIRSSRSFFSSRTSLFGSEKNMLQERETRKDNRDFPLKFS